jgi:malate dehydrogenase (quinone)
MENRDKSEIMAATRMEMGTEVNFGKLTELLFDILKTRFDTEVALQHEVTDIDPGKNTDWFVEVENLKTEVKTQYDAEHVFIGAGGGALPLLQKVEIEGKEGYGGFPVSGQWLVCKNREIVERHHAKVYSKAALDAPPMSTPHLDTRFINGKQELMFGPFAGFSTKFLKEGSYTDLFKSIHWGNIPSMWGVFWHNLPLTEYLIEQVSMSHEDRIEELRDFIKNARPEDWELKTAGQRVQIIKRDEEEGGVLEFGTDVVKAKDGSVTALLGASPGASVAVNIMLEIIETAFPEKFHMDEWQEKLMEMIPFFKMDISENQREFKGIQANNMELLGLNKKT